jgi:type VI secretion system protein ImpC
MAESGAQTQPTPEVTQETAVESTLVDRIVEEFGQTVEEREVGRDWIQAFVDQAMRGEVKRARTLDVSIADLITRVDEKISNQLNEFLHDPKFQKLEASWRGLHYLVDQTETSTMLKLKVLNISRRELTNDLENAVEFDQSEIFKKVYEGEYGQLGGEPYGLLVGDYEFGRGRDDVMTLRKMSGVAAAAHAPFIAASSAGMFGWQSYTEMTGPRDLAKIFDNDLYVNWRSFRESEDSRYVGLALPHMLLRDPYGEDGKKVDAFNFDEKVDGRDHSKYLWGNAAYALATRITNAFSKYEWCAAIRGVEGGGLVEGLPAHTFRTDEGDIALKCPTEVAITDRRENELAGLGFISLCHKKGDDKAVFFGADSCQKARKYYDNEANANARLSAQLQYIMAVSRFAHFLKVMTRDKIGSYASKTSLQRYLNNWIANYVCLNDDADQETKARLPLRDARIEVQDVPGKPGAFQAVAFLRPHFQLDELTVSLRLVANLPPPAK